MIYKKKIWLYFIVDASERSLYVDENGGVGRSAKPFPLRDNPTGWKELTESFGTSTKYFALNRTVNVPMTFVNDGAQILRYACYKGRGYEEELYVQIMRLDLEDDIHKLEYKGKIDFTKMQDDAATGVTVTAIEGGLASYLNSNDGVTYEIPCDETNPNAIKVYFDGVNLKDKYNYKELSVVGLPIDTTFIVPITYVNNEGDSIGVISGSQTFDRGFSSDSFKTSANYLFQSYNQTVQIRLKGRIAIDFTSFISLFSNTLFYSIANSTSVTTTTIGTFSNSASAPVSHIYDFDLLINLHPGEKLFIHGFTSSLGSCTGTFLDNDISITFNTINQPSSSFALRPLDLLKAIVNKMTGGRYTAKSDWLTAHNNIVATCGDALRNTDRTIVKNYLIKTSLEDFFKSYDALYDIAFKIVDDVLICERKQDMFKDDGTEIFDLGVVSKFKPTYYEELLVNTLRIGYPDQDYDERNGKYETNSEQQYKLPVLSEKKELTKMSAYRADAFGIEFIRAKYTGKDSTDNTSDNQVFLVNISTQTNAGAFTLKRGVYDSLTGVLDNTVYNLEEMTPKRMLKANGSYLRSLLNQLPNDKITFQTALKNRNLVTVQGSNTIVESDDIPVNNLDAPFFYPYMLTFTTVVPYRFAELMQSIGNGHIKLSYNGLDFFALPIGTMTSKPVSQEAQEWKLLCSSKTSLDALLKASQTGLFVNGYNNNMIFIHDLNPVHFVVYGQVLPDRYHEVDMYGGITCERFGKFVNPVNYTQKWQKSDSIRLQVITAQLGQLDFRVFDSNGKEVDALITTFTVKNDDPAVKLPYQKQEVDISLQDYPEGFYQFVLYSGSTPLVISEWQEIRDNHPSTYLLEYYHSFNRLGAYFKSWKPMIRVEGLLMPWGTDSTSTEYEDEPGNVELLDGVSYWRTKFYYGDAYGIPDFLAGKINQILLLNRVELEGVGITRNSDAKIEVTERSGYPLNYYAIDIRRSQNASGLVLDDNNIPAPTGISLYTYDATAFGQADGVINGNIDE